MEQRKHHHRWRIVALLLTFLALFVLAAATSAERTRLSWPEQALREVVRPFQAALGELSGQIQRVPAYFTGINALQQENDLLQQEIARLEQELAQSAALAAENARLKAQLTVTASWQDWQPLTAGVIARSTQSWTQRLTINRGSRHGVVSGQPVLAAQGLVGRVTTVSPHSAEVMLLTHPESAVAARILESRWAGVVETDTQQAATGLVLIHLPMQAELIPGQHIESSGLGGLFPAGLPIGTLGESEIETDGLSQRVEIIPYADFDRLEQLTVLLAVPDSAEAVS